MISLPSGTKIWLVAGATDMRKSFNGLGEQIQHVLDEDPAYSALIDHVFAWNVDQRFAADRSSGGLNFSTVF